MVYQAGNISYKESPFYNFTQYRKDNNYFVEKKYTAPQTKTAEEEKSHKVIITLATSALVLGFGILALMRGPKGSNKILSKIKTFLEKKIAQTKTSKTGESVNQFYLSSLNKVNSFIEKSESINNFTSIKDALCRKAMEKHPWSKKIYKKITKMFEKTSRKTVVTAWHNTKERMHKTFDKLSKLDEKILREKGAENITISGVTRRGSEWLEIIKNNRADISNILETNTNSANSMARYKKIKNATKNLDDVTIEIFKDWKNKDLYQTFAADRVILKDKAALFDEMNAFRQQISFTREDKLEMAKNLVRKVENNTLTNDYTLLKQFSQLKTDLHNGAADDKLIKSIDKLKDILTKSDAKIDSEGHVFDLLDRTKELLSKNKTSSSMKMRAKPQPAKLDEMLEIYKRLAPDEYVNIEKDCKKIVKNIDKSINIESEQFFDKVRDLQIGSAPTDVLSILGSAGMIGYGLAKAKDNDERISVTLKAGIPVIGAVGTSLYCTARLISGGKAMAFGLLSGWILNKIGEQTDKLRKNLATK